MGKVITWIDRTFYPNHSAHWDDWLFRERILSHIGKSSVVLDVGAGAGILEQMNFKGEVARICGVDLDPRVVDNPMLDEGRIADAGRIPYGDAVFDLAFADNVFEHLEQPLEVFREVARVLKPGGKLLFKTPNRRHYVPTIARWTPHSVHEHVARMRGRIAEDTFPTVYRANTPGDVTRLAAASGFDIDRLDLVEGRPEYLRIAWPAYVGGLLYERLVNRFEALAAFRVVLVGVLVKKVEV